MFSQTRLGATGRRGRGRPECRQAPRRGRPTGRHGQSPCRRSRRSRQRAPEPGDALDQFVLPVALHAGEADDLARPHIEREVAHRRSPRSPSAVRPSTFAEFRARGWPSCAPRAGTERPTMSARKVLRGDAALGSVAMIRPSRMTEMRSETASTSRSLWVMKMIERPLSARPAWWRRARASPAASAPRSARRG